tara:strand:- start:2549 stop:3319 length:771 start_codon:yes stop_codon:yes gene_type:complete
MNFRVAIPSISRAETITKKTLNYLKQTDINMSKVDIFLSNPNEEQSYRENLKSYPVNIIVSNTKHVNTQRNFIVDYYKEDELILGIDDDIDLVAMKVDDKNTIQLNSLIEFVENAFAISLDKKIDMWGVNPVINPYFMKNNVTFNLKYIVACFYGWRNNHDEKAYVSTNPEYGKEDFERSIRYYIADGGVTRFNYVAPKTKYYSEKGGIQNYRTVEYEETAVKWLLETFPMYCKRNTKSKGKYPEVRLIDQRRKKR